LKNTLRKPENAKNFLKILSENRRTQNTFEKYSPETGERKTLFEMQINADSRRFLILICGNLR
jgi:hypothetical protein